MRAVYMHSYLYSYYALLQAIYIVFDQVGEESRHLGNVYLQYLDYVPLLHQIINSLCCC